MRGWPELKFGHDVANGDLLTFRVLRGALSFSVSAIHLPVDHSIHPSTHLFHRLPLHRLSRPASPFLRPSITTHQPLCSSYDLTTSDTTRDTPPPTTMGMAQILGLGLRGFQVCAPPPTSSTAPHHTNDPRSSSCPCSSWPSSATPSPWEPTHPSTTTPCFAPHSPCYVSSS